MIKKIIVFTAIVILILIFYFVSINILRNNPKKVYSNLKGQINLTKLDATSLVKDWLWKEGRFFEYEVIYMNIFSPGFAEFSLEQNDSFEKGKETFTIKAQIIENSFFKKLYDAKMEIYSIVDKDTKLPVLYQEKSVTPKEKRLKEIKFFHKENIAERKGIKFKIPEKTYDPLSVFFNFLSEDFKLNESIVLELISKEEIYEFKITPIELKNDIYKLSGEVFRKDRSSFHGARFTMWILNGQVRVPLLVKVVSAAGPIYLRLKDIE